MLSRFTDQSQRVTIPLTPLFALFERQKFVRYRNVNSSCGCAEHLDPQYAFELFHFGAPGCCHTTTITSYFLIRSKSSFFNARGRYAHSGQHNLQKWSGL